MVRISTPVGRTTGTMAPYPTPSKSNEAKSNEAPYTKDAKMAPPPVPTRTLPVPDPFADPTTTEAAALLLLLRRPYVNRTTPAEFLLSVDRHLAARGLDITTATIHLLPGLEEMQRRTARHILRSIHDAWAAADPTPWGCKMRCGCVGALMERVHGETAGRILRTKLEDVVWWLRWEEGESE